MRWAVALALSGLTPGLRRHPRSPRQRPTASAWSSSASSRAPCRSACFILIAKTAGSGGRGGPPRDPRMVWDDADRAACEAQTKADRSDGYPVAIKKAYLIGKTEVTQGQWKAVMRHESVAVPGGQGHQSGQPSGRARDVAGHPGVREGAEREGEDQDVSPSD